MSRLPRINVEGAVYYVTSKGLQDKKIFVDSGDFNMYLELLTKYKTQHKFKLFSYNLHPDRIQLLIETGNDATISEIMHDLTSLYTKYYNGCHGKRGHLFESRFKSMLIEKQQYLLAMSRQIHLAPERSSDADRGLRMKDGGVANAYSSYHFYVKGGANTTAPGLDLSQEVQEVKNFLLNKDNPDAYESYCLTADDKEIASLAKSLSRGSVLGSEAFRKEVDLKVVEHSKDQLMKGMDQGTDKVSRTIYVIAGAVVLVLASASVYLYLSKQDVEQKYRTAVKEKEAEFIQKTKFENQSPITPAELEGSAWEVEILGLPSGRPEDRIKDTIRFSDGNLSSQVFGAQGFRPTRYILIPKGKGSAAWQCAQVNADGETIRWQGEWQGSAMKGTFSFQPFDVAQGKPAGAQVFSFFSTGWSYSNEKTL